MHPGNTTPCPNCGQIASTFETVLDKGPHYSRIDCGHCQRFIRWGRKPANENRESVIAEKLTTLAEVAETAWEASFTASVTQQFEETRKLSPKQIETINRIIDRRTIRA